MALSRRLRFFDDEIGAPEAACQSHPLVEYAEAGGIDELDPLEFDDLKPYRDRLRSAIQRLPERTSGRASFPSIKPFPQPSRPPTRARTTARST